MWVSERKKIEREREGEGEGEGEGEKERERERERERENKLLTHGQWWSKCSTVLKKLHIILINTYIYNYMYINVYTQ